MSEVPLYLQTKGVSLRKVNPTEAELVYIGDTKSGYTGSGGAPAV